MNVTMVSTVVIPKVDGREREISLLKSLARGAKSRENERKVAFKNTQRDTGWSGRTIEPKRDPREDDDESRRDVDLGDVVAQTTHKVELHGQPRVGSYLQSAQLFMSLLCERLRTERGLTRITCREFDLAFDELKVLVFQLRKLNT